MSSRTVMIALATVASLGIATLTDQTTSVASGPPVGHSDDTRTLYVESDIGAYAVAYAPADRAVYVVGNQPRSESDTNVDIVIRRYRSDGSLVWQRAHRTSAAEYARGVAVDSAGNVYIAGWIATGDRGDDVLLLAYSPTGTRRWVRTYDDVFNGDDRANAVAVDPQGRVWLAGSVPAASEGSSQVWWGRWTPDGRRTGSWTTEHSIVGRAEALGIAALADGSGIVLAGNMFETIDGSVATTQNVWMGRFDSSGNGEWVRRFGRAGHDDTARGVAVSGDGAVYVTGEAFTGSTGSDLWVRRYSPGGRLVWKSALGIPGDDSGRSIAVAPDGATVVATGVLHEGGFATDAIVRAYTSGGGLIWSRRIDSPGNYAGDSTPDAGLGIAVPGPVYVVGRAEPPRGTVLPAAPWVARLTTDQGTTRWSHADDVAP